MPSPNAFGSRGRAVIAEDQISPYSGGARPEPADDGLDRAAPEPAALDEPATIDDVPTVVRAAPRQPLRNRYDDFAADLAPPAAPERQARAVDPKFDPRLRPNTSAMPVFKAEVHAAEQRGKASEREAAAAERKRLTEHKQFATRAKKDFNNEFEAEARATGVQMYADADGVLRPVVDDKGRQKYHASKWEPDPEKAGHLARRNEYGDTERKPARLLPSRDLADPMLYFDLGNGQRDIAGHVDDLVESNDTVVASTAQRWKAQRDKAIRAAGGKPLLDAELAAETELKQAKLQINELSTAQQALQQQLAALPLDQAKETEGGFLGIGGKPTANAQAVAARRSALETQVGKIQEQIASLSAKTASGAAGEGELAARYTHAKLTRELYENQAKTHGYGLFSEKRAALLRAAGKDPEKDEAYLQAKAKETEYGVFASKTAQALRARRADQQARDAAARQQVEPAVSEAAPNTGAAAPNKQVPLVPESSGLTPENRAKLERRVVENNGRQLYELSKEREQGAAGTAGADPRAQMPGMNAVPVSDEARKKMSRGWADVNPDKAKQVAAWEKNPAIKQAAIAHAFEQGDEKFAPDVKYAKRPTGELIINPSLLKPDFGPQDPENPKPTWRTALAEAEEKGDISEAHAKEFTKRAELKDYHLRGAMQDRVMELPSFQRWAASKGLAETKLFSANAADFNVAWGSPKLRAAADEFMRSEPGVAEKVWNTAMSAGGGFTSIASGALKGAGTLTTAAAKMVGFDVDSNPLTESGETIEQSAQAVDPRLSDRWFTQVSEGVGSTLGFAVPTSTALKVGTEVLTLAKASEKTAKVVQRWIGAGTVGTLGGVTQAQQVIDEAKAAGMSDDDALTLAPLGLAVGATEVLSPLQKWAGRIAGTGRSAVLKKFVSDLFTEALEESAQELGQTAGANAIAQKFYDEHREIFEGSEEAVKAAGGSAALMTALTHVIGGIRNRGAHQASRVQLASEQQYRKLLQEGIADASQDPQTVGAVELVGPAPAIEKVEAARTSLEAEIRRDETSPTMEPEQLLAKRQELIGLERLNNAVLADYANRIAAAKKAEAEIAAIDDYAAPAGPDGSAGPAIDPATGRTAARALVRIANGATSGELTAEEQKAVGAIEKLEFSDAAGTVPMIRTEKGGEVITDRAIEWLRERAPAAADLIRLTETDRLRELSTQAKQAAEEKAAAKVAPNTEAKLPDAKAALPQQSQIPAKPALRVSYADQTGTQRDAQIPTGARLSTGESVTIDNADRWLAENGVAGARDVRALGSEITRKPVQAAAAPAGGSASGRLTGDAVAAAIDAAHADTKGYTPEVRRQHAETLTQRISEAVEAYRPVFGDNVEFRTSKPAEVRGGGFRFEGGKLIVDLGEIAHAKNLPALLKNEKRVAKLVQEEAIHSVAVKLFPERKGVEELWAGVGEKVQAQVRAIYRNDKADDWQMGHELLRMIVQGRLAVQDGRFAFDGKVSEETASESVLARIAEFLAKVRDYFQETAKRLRTDGADEKAASQLEAAAAAVESRLRKLVRHGDGDTSATVEADGRRADQVDGGERDARGRAIALTGASEGEVGNVEKVTHKGRSYRTVAVVIDATRANTSHDPAGRVNSDYPSDLQPRDRSDAFYREQQRRIAGNPNLDEEAKQGSPDSGPPIMAEVGGRLVTLIGNGRANAKALMYSSEDFADTAKAYVDQLVEVAKARGISESAIRNTKNPTLARVIVDELSPDELREISRESNQFAGAETNAVEQADVDAGALTPGVLALYDSGFDLMANRNAGFRREFAAALFGAKGGNITEADLERRIRLALFAKAYGGTEAGRAAFNRLAGETSDSTRNITGALFDAAPMFAAMKDSIAAGALRSLDISADVADAAQAIGVALRERPANQSADAALEGLVGQTELAMGGDSTLSRAIVDFLVRNRRSRVAMTEGLRAYVSAVYQAGDPKQEAMFADEPPPTREGVWKMAEQVAGSLPSNRQQAVAALMSAIGDPTPEHENPQIHFALVAREMDVRHPTIPAAQLSEEQQFESLRERFGADRVEAARREAVVLIARAAPEKAKFDEWVRSTAARLGAIDVALAPVKSVARTVEKALVKGKPVSEQKDSIRATIVVGSVKDAQTVMETLKAELGDRLKKAKDNFATSTPTGYADINLVFERDGVLAELQINVPEMMRAKSIGYRIYARERSLPAAKWFGPEHVALVADQDAIYRAARIAIEYRVADDAGRSAMLQGRRESLGSSASFTQSSKATGVETDNSAISSSSASKFRPADLPLDQNSKPSSLPDSSLPKSTTAIPDPRKSKKLALGGNEERSIISPDNTGAGSLRQPGSDLSSSAGSEQFDLFDLLDAKTEAAAYVESLPTGASNTASSLRAEVAKDSARLAANDRVIESLQGRVAKPMTIEMIEGEQINRSWTAFAPESGTLAIPRAEMPQIESEHRGALTQFLRGRGIEHTQEDVLPGTLKPTQREYSPAKVDTARKYREANRAILVSSDHHVLDGHHQYVAALTDAPDALYPVIRFNAPIRDLLPVVKEFPSAETAGGSSRQATTEAPNPKAKKARVSDFGEKIGGARKDLAEKRTATGPAEKKPADARPPWMRYYEVAPETRWGGYGKPAIETGKFQLKRKGKALRTAFATEEEARKAIPLMEALFNHSIGMDRKTKKWAIIRTLSNDRRPVVKSGFESEDDAKRYLAGHPVEIIEHKFEFPERPWLDRIVREGPTVRTDDVTPEAFQKAFGFRGGEFGNWNMGADGQAALNHAYDALFDLSRMLGIPPRAISLNGRLAIAFGARGHGLTSSRAHYERDYRVINLTKIKGAGALAHEWLHALDHYLGVFPNYGDKAASDRESDYASHGGVTRLGRPELREVYQKVVAATVRQEVTKPIDPEATDRRWTAFTQYMQREFSELRRQFVQWPEYKKRPAPTTEQQKEFDALIERIANGDWGAPATVQSESAKSVNFGRASYERVEELNTLFKQVTGRSFATMDDNSIGRRLVGLIDNAQKIRARVEAAASGAKETVAVQTDYLRNARDIDQLRASDYWSTPHEMVARAFEAFVADRLEAAGHRSDYLVYGAENKFYAMLDMKPYPEGEERTAINRAFEELFKTVKVDEANGAALFSAPGDFEGQSTFDEALEGQESELPAAADQTISGSVADLVKNNLGLATSIAAKYFTPANVSEHNDIVQVARMGLIKAARKFDVSRGYPFASYAGRTIRNELNDYYGGEKKRVTNEVSSLDEPTGEDGEKAGDKLAAPETNVAAGLETEESRRAVIAAVDALPERPRLIVRGVMIGKSFEEIADDLGISRQAAHQSWKGALILLKRNLQKQGIKGIDAEDAVILSSEGSDDEAIRELMELIERDIPRAAMDANQAKAEGEAGTTEKTVGRPDLANPAGDEAGRQLVNAVDETRTIEAERQQQMQWSQAAEQMVARDRDGVRRALLEKAADPDQNGNLTAIEVKAAKLLVAEMTARAMATKDAALLREAQILTYAYRETGTEQGRALAARRDEFMRPADRHREFLAAMVFHPRPALAKQIETLPTPAAKSRRIAALEQQIAELRGNGKGDPATEKKIAELTVELGRVKQQRDRVDALVAASNDKIAKIEKLLAKMGVTLGDLFSGDAYLRLKGAKIVDNVTEAAGYDATKKRVLKLIQSGWSNAEISKRTKLSESQVATIEADFVAKLEKRLDQLGDAALDLSKLDTSALFAAPGGEERKLSADERAKRRAEIIKALGFNRAQERDARTKRVNRAPRRPATAKPSTRIPTGAAPPAVPDYPSADGRTRDDFGNRQLGLGEDAGAQPNTPEFPDSSGAIDVTGGNRQLELAEDPDAMPPVFDIADPVQVAQIARAIQSTDGNRWDMAYEFWINSILSGPLTQVANIAGNSANAALDMSLQRGVEAAVNSVLSSFGKGSEQAAQFGEFRHLFRGIAPGIVRGLRNGIAAWTSETSLFDNDVLNAQIDLDLGKLETTHAAIPGKAGRIVRIPGRTLMFVDDFFKGALGTMQAGAEAYRIAKSEGLAGEAMERRITGLVNLPGSPAWVRAAEKARELTFQQEIDNQTAAGSVADAVTHVRRMVPGARYAVPFIRTLFNVFLTGVRKSPLGSINMAARFVQHGFYQVDEAGNARGRRYDRPEMIKHLSEQVIAFAATAMVLGFGEGDEDDGKKFILITGSRPYDPSKQGISALNARTGNGAYMIRVGDKTFSYGRLEPLATVLGVTVDTLKIAKLSGRVDGNQLFGATWRAVAEQVASKTFAQGIGDALKAIQSDDKATNWLANFASSWVPNIIRQPLRNIDPYVRELSTEASTRDLPGRFMQRVAKQALPLPGAADPKIDIWGNPIEKTGNALSRLVIPGEAGEARQANRVDAMLLRWNQMNPSENYAPEPPTRRVEVRTAKGEKKPYFMSDEEFTAYQKRSGQLAARMLLGVPLNMANPSKADVDRVRNAFAAARAQTRRTMFAGKILADE